MKRLLGFVLCIFSSLAYGQINNPGGGNGITITNVAGLASVPGKTNGTIAVVTNGASATDCTVGGGTTVVNCQFNGTIWSQAVASSSGGTAFSALTTASNTTAAMTVGTGASLGPAGTGTITATNTQASAAFAPTADGVFGVNTTTHLPVFGSNTTTLTWPQTLANAAHKWLNSYSQTAGTFTQTQPACGDLSDVTAFCNLTPGTGVTTFLTTPSSANLLAAMTTSTGSGNLVFGTSPTLVTPVLGTPTSVTLTNGTGLPISTGVSGLGTGVATFLATPTSGNLAAALTDETGSGNAVFSTSPTLVTPNLGTPSALTLTNASGLPLAGLANQAADTIDMNASGSSAAPTAVAMPTTGTNGCAGSANALQYNTTTHAWACNTISGSGTVNSGTATHLAFYSSSTNAVSSDGTATDDGTTLTYTGTGGLSLSAGPLSISAPAGDAGYLSLSGNTANQTVTSNTVGFMGPTSATFTAYALQLPATAPSGTQTLQCGTPTGSVSACSFSSAGAGTVTVVASGSLTSTALVTGGGSQTLQTPSATSTLDGSGNLSLAAGGSLKSADTGTPGFTFATNSVSLNQPLSIAKTSNQMVMGTTTNLSTLTFPASSGAVTLTFPNTSTLMLGGNSDTTTTDICHASATAGICNFTALVAADIPTSGISNVVYKNTTNAATSAMTLDMSGATGSAAFKVPSTTTNTASAAAVIDYDTTNSNYHANSGADSLIGIVPTASVPTNGNVIDASVSSSKFLLHDSGVATANITTAASNYTSGDLVQAAGNNKTTSDSGVATANVVQATSAATAAKQICTATSTTKSCSYIDFPEVLIIPAANCNNTTAGAAWSIGSGGTVTCRGGTNNLGGYVSITDTASTFATFQFVLPEDWDTANNPYIRFQIASTDATLNHTIIPSIQVACYKGDGSTTDDVAANAAHSLSTTTLNGNANRFWSTSNVQMNATDMTGCVAGALVQVTVGRATDTATNAEFYSATITIPRLMTVQAN